jgi:hypothetical protein
MSVLPKSQKAINSRISGFLLLIFLLAVHIPLSGGISDQTAGRVTGMVFHDVGKTGVFDPAVDKPLQGVAVSNGRDIVLTDPKGRYTLDVEDHTIIFVIKPRNWSVPVDNLQIPRFYHIHNPDGARGEKFRGLAPTPRLPGEINFPLYPSDEPDRFEVILFADTQSRNEQELDFLAKDAIEELVGTGAAFGVTLGDLVFDDLDLFEPTNQLISRIGIPWRHIIGNHDLDFSAGNNTEARGAYYNQYGPSYYSFEYGPAHFIVLDNVRFMIRESDNHRYYRPELDADQLKFVENELSRINKNRLLVVMMHIPWDDRGWNMQQRDQLMGLLSNHPNAISIGAHWHRHYHAFLGADYGFKGDGPHHMISLGAVCGAWWRGMPDEYGIPHAIMSDGTPPGYGILHVNGTEAKLHWQSSRRRPDFQMHVAAPDFIDSAETEGLVISANIFNALPDASVRMRVGQEGQWIEMERIPTTDPVKEALIEREKLITSQLAEIPWIETRSPGNSPKSWQAKIPSRLEPGTHLIEIVSEDRWWVHRGNRIIRVVTGSLPPPLRP